MRAILRALSLIVAGPLLIIGAVGVVRLHAPKLPGVATAAAITQRVVASAASAAQLPAEWIEATQRPGFAYAAVGAAITLLVLGGRRRRTMVLDGAAARRVGKSAGAEREGVAPIDRRTQRRIEKQAAGLAKKGQFVEAADLFFEVGSLDRAAELYAQAEQWIRAAEIRHDQNRFTESADLYVRAGRLDTAGTILSTQGEWAQAAECYAKANRLSVAAEMFEKAEQWLRAGECYRAVGFQRHAAQSFVKCQAWKEAAGSLEDVIAEETARTGSGQDPKKQKELRTLVLQAGKLHEQSGDLAKAQAVLERGSCFVAAAEIAQRREDWPAAAELFLRGRETLKAADALRRSGQNKEAARLLGEWHRDHGEEQEAAESFEQAEEWSSAGDLYRKLERYERAGACYERAGDTTLAAEMYRSGGELARAVDCYTRSSRFSDAAECQGALGDRAAQAALLAKAGRLLDAGRILHELGHAEDAIKLLQGVEAGSPDFGQASSLLGTIFQTKGQHGLAVKKFQQAVGGAPLARENVPAFFALAVAQEAAGELAEAVEQYEKILGFDYHYPEVETRLAAAREKAALLGASTPSPLASGAAVRSGGTSDQPARYQVVGELGRGGMGIVYKARDTVLDRIVAFKVLPEALRENPQALKNFLREAKSAAQLNHPNIVTVYDAGEQEGRTYIAMEYVDGTTLKEILRKRGAIAPGGVMHVLVQMCEALAYAHEKKIVHRDVKTANTMWTRDKKAKIMDFGLAKVVEEVRNHTTLVSGTPYYMSPEQTLGRNVDQRTDIYSLGVTIFELATGLLPFREGNVPYHHVHTPPPDPREANPSLPVPLAMIISRCLQKSPDARYQSTREILAELRTAVSQGGVPTRRA